ncbi:MAG: hypothetical protein EBZ77_07790 [Chitinophagia bacterium]|nr:hypothetical protein [Chitinophagia bacterium]
MLSTIILLHSIARFLVLLLVFRVAIQCILGIAGKKEFAEVHRKGALFAMISCDIQLLLGLILSFMGGHFAALTSGAAMASKYARFYSLEHPFGMGIAITMVHLAYVAAKKAGDSSKKFRKVLIFTVLSIVFMMAMMPWPNKPEVGKPWIPGVAIAK